MSDFEKFDYIAEGQMNFFDYLSQETANGNTNEMVQRKENKGWEQREKPDMSQSI